MAGYSPDEIRDIARRFAERSDRFAAAEEAARAVRGFGGEIQRIEAEIAHVSDLWPEPPGRREQLEEERRRLVVEALTLDAAPPAAAEPVGTGAGVTTSRESVDRYGKDYDGALVEEVVRLAHIEQALGRGLGRTLRNELYAKTDATTYMIDTIFRLMKSGTFADTRREGWLKVAGVTSATPRFINLHELETRS
jgi:hypothetical protein